jgi:chorismate-pyruvate lyase
LEDIVPNVSRPSDLDLVRRMEGLVTLINAMDCLSESVGTWLNISDGEAHGITHELLDQHPWTADDDQARHLQLGRGEKKVYRTGALWAEIRGHPTRLATADCLVVWSRLPRSVRADLDKGIPIGLALKSLGARRYTDPAVFRYDVDDAGTR